MTKPTEKMAVFTVRPAKEEGGKDFWTEIGTLFPHEKGEGFTILLNALPLDAKLVVLPRKEQEKKDGAAAKPTERAA